MLEVELEPGGAGCVLILGAGVVFLLLGLTDWVTLSLGAVLGWCLATLFSTYRDR